MVNKEIYYKEQNRSSINVATSVQRMYQDSILQLHTRLGPVLIAILEPATDEHAGRHSEETHRVFLSA